MVGSYGRCRVTRSRAHGRRCDGALGVAHGELLGARSPPRSASSRCTPRRAAMTEEVVLLADCAASVRRPPRVVSASLRARAACLTRCGRTAGQFDALRISSARCARSWSSWHGVIADLDDASGAGAGGLSSCQIATCAPDNPERRPAPRVAKGVRQRHEGRGRLGASRHSCSSAPAPAHARERAPAAGCGVALARGRDPALRTNHYSLAPLDAEVSWLAAASRARRRVLLTFTSSAALPMGGGRPSVCVHVGDYARFQPEGGAGDFEFRRDFMPCVAAARTSTTPLPSGAFGRTSVRLRRHGALRATRIERRYCLYRVAGMWFVIDGLEARADFRFVRLHSSVLDKRIAILPVAYALSSIRSNPRRAEGARVPAEGGQRAAKGRQRQSSSQFAVAAHAEAAQRARRGPWRT